MTRSRSRDADGGPPAAITSAFGDHPFALCLTHDVDRVYKTYQSVYYAATDRDPGSLLDLLPWRRPYWQFPTVMALEEELGVRSAFYFLDEQHLFRDKPVHEWVRPENWKLYLGRYELDDPAIADAIRELDAGGWEVGLHGSYESYRDRDRLRKEKQAVESVLGHEVLGGRQHYLNLERPTTWRYQAEVGLRYDATLGQTRDYGFQGRYWPFRPFDDEFVVFPLSLMELTLPGVESDPEGAWRECERLLQEARENEAVMTVLWHPSYFSERDHPNYRTLYRRLVERALEMGAWVGPPGDFYARLDHPDGELARTEPVDGRTEARSEPAGTTDGGRA